MDTSFRRSSRNYSIHSPNEKWDYIIIGSGMGGMTSAALLTKLGKKVLLLEQHYVPGGFTHTFKRKRWRWDIGVHAVGEVTTHTAIGRLLAKLTDNQLQWASLGDVYDEFYFPDSFRIDFPNTPQQFVANLKTAFPEEQTAIDQYLSYVRQVSKAMRKYYLSRVLPHSIGSLVERSWAKDAHKFLLKRTKNVLDELTANERLKTVIASQWGYYGCPPSESSFAIQALVAKHFFYGGYYPVGGAKKLPMS